MSTARDHQHSTPEASIIAFRPVPSHTATIVGLCAQRRSALAAPQLAIQIQLQAYLYRYIEHCSLTGQRRTRRTCRQYVAIYLCLVYRRIRNGSGLAQHASASHRSRQCSAPAVKSLAMPRQYLETLHSTKSSSCRCLVDGPVGVPVCMKTI